MTTDGEFDFNTADSRPIIAVTMGDPVGVGPEIILKALNTKAILDICRPVVVGDLKVLEDAKGPLPRGTQPKLVPVDEPMPEMEDGIQVIDMNNVDIEELKVGAPGAYAGVASVSYIKKAVEL